MSIDGSWLIIFGASAVVLAFFVLPVRWAGAFGTWVSGHWDVSHWAVGLLAGGLFFGSMLAHELAHLHRAARYGLGTTRVRLHVFGDIVDTAYQPSSPKQQLGVALAGPIVSAVLAAVCLGLGWVLPQGSLPQVTAQSVGEFNLFVTVISLLPGFPLDGGRVLHAVIWKFTDLYRATRAASPIGMGLSFLLAAGGCYWLAMSYSAGSGQQGLGILYGPWTLLVAWFLWSAARAAHRDASHRLRLSTARVHVVTRPFTQPPFSHDASVEEVWQAIVDDRARPPCWAVADAAGDITNWITRRDVAEVPPERRPGMRLGEIVQAVDSVEVMASNLMLDAVLNKVRRDRRGFYVVRDEERIVGWVYADDLVEGKRLGTTG